MHNWRLLEAEIEAILRRAGVEICEGENGDKGLVFTDDNVIDLNLTEFAKELSDRVTVNAKPIGSKG